MEQPVYDDCSSNLLSGEALMASHDHTTEIRACVDRLKAGDESARAALLECASARLTRLARTMLHDNPAVARWEQTDDVLQNALIRLDRALRAVVPPTTGDFFRLAAALIRRELIDLARRYKGPEGLGVRHSSREGLDGLRSSDGPSDTTFEPARLAEWAEFHRVVESLSDDDREVFDLLWYQGLTQAEAAAVLSVSDRTINRRWIAARLRLAEVLGGQMPV
jgi:RNA polymerase sigma-70 factor (ECF subfamily)